MNEEQFEELTRRLDILIRLTAVNVTSGRSLTEQVTTLNNLGLKPIEIAVILGKPANLVRAMLSRVRKKGKGS